MLSVIMLFLFGCTGKSDDSSDTAAWLNKTKGNK